MINRLLAALLAVTVFSFTSNAADPENPYKKVKVGDYAKYKVSMKGQLPISGTITQTVTAKDDKEVTVRVTMKIEGGLAVDIPPQDQKIDLTKAYDPTKIPGLPTVPDAKFEKVKDGKEKIKIGEKEYEATWVTYTGKAKVKAGGLELDLNLETKVWTSGDFALNLLKAELVNDTAGQKTEVNLELLESGGTK